MKMWDRFRDVINNECIKDEIHEQRIQSGINELVDDNKEQDNDTMTDEQMQGAGQ